MTNLTLFPTSILYNVTLLSCARLPGEGCFAVDVDYKLVLQHYWFSMSKLHATALAVGKKILVLYDKILG